MTTPQITPRNRWAKPVAIAVLAAQIIGGTAPAAVADSNNPFGVNPGILGAIADSSINKCGSSAASFAKDSGSSAPTEEGGTAVSGFKWEQLDETRKNNARGVVEEAERRGLPREAAVIAIATTIVESGIQTLNYGDEAQGVRNPDGSLTTSKGMFQQQDFWGSLETRLSPSGSAGLFFDRLVKLDYLNMEPGAAAQAVQGSAFPGKYATEISNAESIVDGVTGGNYKAADVPKEDKKDSDSESKDDKDKDSDSGSSSSGTACESGSSTSGGKVGKGVKGAFGDGDDYPLEITPDSTIDLGFAVWKLDSDIDPWGTYVGQCVSWVMWRLNKQMGYKEGKDYPLTAAKMGTAGQMNGYQMSGSFAKAGYKTDKEPAPGAVAWWDANAFGMGPYGHVAIVEKVDKEAGKVYISQYNAGEALTYSEQWYDINKISGFIHVADIEK